MVDRRDETGLVSAVLPLASFRCDVNVLDSRAVVMVAGEVDLATAPVLLKEARAAFTLPISGLALDLGCVSFLDCSGIRALLRMRSEALERGVSFTLGAVQPQARKVLEVTNLAELFELLPRPSSSLPPSTIAGAAA